MNTEPTTPPDDLAGSDVEALQADLATPGGGRLARYAGRAHTAVRILAVAIAAVGLLALAVGLGAWRSSVPAMVVIAVLCLPAVLLPIYVARRTGVLARAVANPHDMAAQAQDLMGRVRDSADLAALRNVFDGRSGRGRRTGPSGEQKLGIRRAASLARSASAVIGQAHPDEENHPLLVPFTPERMARTWTAAGWSVTALVVAILVLVVSIPVLVISFF